MNDIAFDNSYARLPERFHTRTPPTPVRSPRLIRLNHPLAHRLGLDADAMQHDGAAIFSGNALIEGSEPIATAYAGHQFGGFVPQLGDGRAILLGEVIDRAGVRRDIQLKGAGRTPFSRGGDGRAALGPVLREYVVSEAMAALGIPTTRALAAVTTGEKVLREGMLPGAILTRVASSHIRVGTFQYFASRGDTDALRLLADHVIARHYPHAADADRPYRALLDAIIHAQATLIPQWLLVGFIHGVMNTDNTSVAGETIDYGPCAFMDEYNPDTVYSAIDRNGRYAYSQQPGIAHWNLIRLAECFLPLLADGAGEHAAAAAVEDAKDALDAYAPVFQQAYDEGLCRKIGIFQITEGDVGLAHDLLERMAAGGADFTLTFRRLCTVADGGDHSSVSALFADPAAFDAWVTVWRQRIAGEPVTPDVGGGDTGARGAATGARGPATGTRGEAMRAANPAYIPRNHRVEAVIRAAVDNDDFQPFEQLLAVVTDPFREQADCEAYAVPPQEHERVRQTFCGT